MTATPSAAPLAALDDMALCMMRSQLLYLQDCPFPVHVQDYSRQWHREVRNLAQYAEAHEIDSSPLTRLLKVDAHEPAAIDAARILVERLAAIAAGEIAAAKAATAAVPAALPLDTVGQEAADSEPEQSQPTMAGPNAVAAEPLAAQIGRLEMSLGESGNRIFAIALSPKSSDDKMREICDVDAAGWGWTSPRWSKLLNVSAAAIRQTHFWRVDRPPRRAAALELFREKYPGREPPAEP
jgi:hypothetical protein